MPLSLAAAMDRVEEGPDFINPPQLRDLERLERTTGDTVNTGEEDVQLLDIRRDATREAALSYGARGGLAWRTYHIRKSLEERATYMDRVFDFSHLVIPAPSGFLVEPPVISESINAMIVDGTGMEAAVSDRIYDIIHNARIISAPRSWRNYLEREWGDVSPPPDVLRPNSPEERDEWIDNIRKGWDVGIRQADEIFQQDLDQLSGDYRGMIRYRMLLAQGMVSPPYVLQVDRGVVGGGKTMRVGDRAVKMTGIPQLMSGADEWTPASR